MKKYDFKPYDPSVTRLFAEEKDRLARFLPEACPIEHIGSTAIPGLGGKGIIDMMVAVPAGQLETTSRQAQAAGYLFRSSASTPSRLFLRTEYPEDFATGHAFHLHITFPDSADWIEAIAFRDYLRSHPEDLRRYAEIKQIAAQQTEINAEKYMHVKEDLVKEILAKAIEEAG